MLRLGRRRSIDSERGSGHVSREAFALSPNPISLDRWRGRGEWLHHAAGPVFTRSEGDGPGGALLLIHGFPTASWDWARVWPALTPHFQCHTLDMIGYGLSTKPRDFAYSVRAQADLIEDFLTARKVCEFAILAHDFGDTVAQELLARHNEGSARQQLTKVVFLNGGLFPETHQPLLIQRLLAGPLGQVVARLGTRQQFAANMRKICARPPTSGELDGMWRLMSRENGASVLPKLIGYMAERRTHRARWVSALQDSRVPLRLINGLLDPISGAHMVARYRELIANADVVELKDVGHYPQVEAADDVARAALEFLR